MNESDKQQLRRLYPELSDEELEETLTAYTALLVRMVERRRAERRNKKRPGGLE